MPLQRQLFIVIGILSLGLPGFAQRYAAIADQRFYGTPNEDSPARILRDKSGALYLFGSTTDTLGNTDFLVIKVGPTGNELWRKTWGGPGYDALHDATINKYGEIYFVGVTGSDLPHPEYTEQSRSADYYVGRLSPDGERIWVRALGGSDRDVGNSIGITNYDGIVLTGMTWSRDYDVGAHELPLNNQWLVILNRDGRVLRAKVFGGNKNDWGSSVACTFDGGIVVGGVTNSEDLDFAQARHNGDGWFMKLDFAGNMQWSQLIKKPYEDIIYRVVANKYGLTVAVGSQVTADNGKQFWVLKMDDRGRVVFDKQLGGNGFEELLGAAICEDGGLVLVGYSEYLDLHQPGTKGLRDVWVIRTSPQGDVLWQKSLGGPQNETGVDVLEASPGVIQVLCKKKNTFNNPQGDTKNDFWVVTLSDQPCREVQLDIISDLPESRPLHAGASVKFVNRSTLGESFVWDFGDGTASTERSPSKVYQQPGHYTVKVTATLNQSCHSVYFFPKTITVE